MNSRQLVKILDELAPPRLAEKWDNTGISFGDLDKEISKIMVALEPSEAVIDQAIEEGIDVIVTHHPMIFKPIDMLSYDSLIGKKVTKLAQNNIVTFSMHTNMDVAVMAGEVAQMLDLKDVTRLEVTQRDNVDGEDIIYGFGSIGYTSKTLTFDECVQLVKDKFNIDNVRIIGKGDTVTKIAVLPGSGKSFIKTALKEKVDVLITGDIDYHSAIDAIDMGVNVIDAGHFETEHFFVEYMERYLQKICKEHDCNISVMTAIEESPFKVI